MANADRRAERLRPLLSELRAAGITSLIQTAAELNRRQIATPRHGQWHPMTVARLVARLRTAERRRDDEEPVKLAA